tara:strand:+ start:1426 stop:1671 length:246 start_codon:yes stop_codon:yes gene_type:complete
MKKIIAVQVTHPLAEDLFEGLIQTIVQQLEMNGDSQHLQIIANACDEPITYFKKILSRVLRSSMLAEEVQLEWYLDDEDRD